MSDLSPTSPSGFIPQSTALAEAEVESLGELLSRDPFTFTGAEGRPTRDKIVKALRDQRAKFEAADAIGGKTKAVKVGAAPLSLETKVDSSDLGF